MEDNQKEEIENEEDIPAPSASLMNLDLNLKQSTIDLSKFFCYVKGDITTMQADVIVNSSSPGFNQIQGVSKCIHEKCGKILLNYLLSNYNGLLPGGIVDSPNFGMKCKKIIHAVGPFQQGDRDQDLEIIYIQCLNYCFSHRYKSIIFPCISTGGNMFDEDRACAIALNACKNWIERFGDYWDCKVCFCCYTDKSFEVYKKYFKEILNVK